MSCPELEAILRYVNQLTAGLVYQQTHAACSDKSLLYGNRGRASSQRKFPANTLLYALSRAFSQRTSPELWQGKINIFRTFAPELLVISLFSYFISQFHGKHTFPSLPLSHHSRSRHWLPTAARQETTVPRERVSMATAFTEATHQNVHLSRVFQHGICIDTFNWGLVYWG